MSGFIKLHRGWRDNPVFSGEYSRGEAWVWLIENAAWKPTRTRIKGSIVTLERGELTFSVRFLAEAWGWSKSRVDRFLADLRNEGMIKTRSKIGTISGTQGGTGNQKIAGQGQNIICLCNYDKYQTSYEESRDEDGSKSGTLSEPPRGTTAGQQRDKEEEGNNTVPNGTGPPPTLAERIWSEGLAYIVAHGKPEKSARSLLGKWRKALGDDGLLTAIGHCQATGVLDPVSYIEAAAKKRTDPDAERQAFLERRYGG